MARKAKKNEAVEVDAENHLKKDLAAGAVAQTDQASDNVSVDNAPKCGQTLLAARESQGFTAKDIAKQLRLSSTQIESLEKNDFAALPEATIVKGFIRNYAKLLNISAEPLLADYAATVPEKTDYSFTLDPGINMRITDDDKSNKMRYVLLALGLLLGLGIWFFYQNYVQKPSPINPMPEIVEALPEIALPRSERAEATEAAQLDIAKQGVTQEQNSTQFVNENKDVAENKDDSDAAPSELISEKTLNTEVATELVNEEVTQEAIITEAAAVQSQEPGLGETRLEFSATQETWLSVVNTSGREVYNKILYAGNHEVVDVRNPKEIVVGNAHGATLIVDGKVVDLAPYTRINVARVPVNRLPR